MRDLLQTGAEMLDRVRKREMARTVTYVRGAASVELAATVGKTMFPVDNGTAAPVTFESRDYIVSAADLVLGGEQALPERGDRIRDEFGGTVHVYEVMVPGGQLHYRLSGPEQNILRIHTKLVDTEEV